MVDSTNARPAVVGIDVQLAVVSAADADQITLLIGPLDGAPIPHAQCSVMVVH